jgi:hypothetical protein
LFSSGVGFFQRSASIQGDTTLQLSFRAEQVNDILKSLVLFDPAGAVRPVSYAANEPISRRLRTAGLALNPSVTLGALLRQFQGARLRLETGADPTEGQLISVSQKPMPAGGKDGAVVQVDVINVLTETGLKAIPLDSVGLVRLLDARLDRELRESLQLLATGLDDQKRSVEIRFSGNAAREVRAGYLQEMPVWKTSYRLVLDKQRAPYLQGWALVENITDEDWQNVRLSLVSGRPVSFMQDLYQPLFVPRPVVQAQLVGSPVPQTYGETLEAGKTLLADRDGRLQEGERKAGTTGPPGPSGAPAQLHALGGGAFAGRALARRPPTEQAPATVNSEAMVSSVAAQAAGAERGDLFEYRIEQQVSLQRGKAAMVPIVTQHVEGEKVSIFDPASAPQHALHGFRLRNSTPLHLAGGPITIFQDGAYAGDAQIGNLQPKEDRLLSYAVDLDLVVGQESPRFSQSTMTFTARSGVLTITRKQQRVHTYTFRNKSAQAKTVLVQQALEPEFKLVEPEKPEERTANSYRLKVGAPAGATASLKVVTERPISEGIALIDADLNTLTSYALNGQVSEKVRSALKDLVAQRRKIAELQGQRAGFEAEAKTIDQEQGRIRQNMAQLDRTNALYQQYVKKLTDQETRIEKIREEIARVRQAEAAAQKELREFVDGLTLA